MPKASKKRPIVFLNAPINTFFPPRLYLRFKVKYISNLIYIMNFENICYFKEECFLSYKLLNKENIQNVLDILVKTYPEVKCGLDYTTPFELVISLILAAQCTDKRVNIIRPILTEKYPTPADVSKLEINEIYSYIKSCSFPNNKSKHILDCSKVLVEKFNSEVPSTMEDLLTLPGIGRKSANIILSECFNNPVGIAVDTHVKRITKRIGLTNNTEPEKIEKDLMCKIPKEIWKDINHILVTHGREICIARKPKCSECPINSICREYITKSK